MNWPSALIGFSLGVGVMIPLLDYLVDRAWRMTEVRLEQERENWRQAYHRYWESKQ